MSWGHAVSSDLVHRKQLPVAIYNGRRETNQSQYIAFSNDRGRRWTVYDRNPVLDIGRKDFRDPKVFWYEPQQRWVMVLALPDQRLREGLLRRRLLVGVPREDGRRLWLGWMNHWQYAQEIPTAPWRSAQSLPRTLALRTTSHGIRLVQQPVRELQQLRGARRTPAAQPVAEGSTSRSAVHRPHPLRRRSLPPRLPRETHRAADSGKRPGASARVRRLVLGRDLRRPPVSLESWPLRSICQQ